MIFSRNRKPFLTKEETEEIKSCIQKNEKSTSGEIRLCIESRCTYTDPMRRAFELFNQLKMHKTSDRNAILIYIAYRDRDFALFADKAVHAQVDATFWSKESKYLAQHFHRQEYVSGIIECINHVGIQLSQFFPWEGENKNELPDEIVLGK